MPDSPRVLVVDDDVDFLHHVLRILAQHGLCAEGVESVADALQRLAGARYDVLLCDVHMPEHGGLDLLAAVRHHDPDVPVVLMTGDPTLDTAIMAVEGAAFAYLTKPVSRTTLLPTLERAVAASEAHRAQRVALARVSAEA